MIKVRLSSTKQRTRLTILGKLLVFIIIIIPMTFFFRGLNDYLSENDSIQSKLLAVEGFLPDYTLKDMLTEFYEGGYEKMIIIGKPIGQGYYLSGYQTSSDLMKSTLIEMGLDSSLMISISIPETVFRDRTYSTGLLLWDWMNENHYDIKRVNLYTLGSHSRRSRLLFEKALGDDYEFGIIAGKDLSYNHDKWWKSSKGFRTVLNETLAYVYARFLFYPDRDQALKDLKAGYFIDKIQYHRNAKDLDYAKAESSPMTEEQLKTFVKLKYFYPNSKYKVEGVFVKETETRTFEMKTSTDRLPLYSTYGKIHFKLDGEDYVISAYQNVELVKRPGYENYLFIPFRDLSSGEETYGAGRFLDFRFNGEEKVTLDFNLAYNPLCAYNHKYSCPLPPYENHLGVKILAGEKTYEEH
jgi:uncharacterized protein